MCWYSLMRKRGELFFCCFFWQNAEQRDGSKLWDFFFPVSLLSACAPPMTSISSLSDRYTQSVLRSYTYMANAEKWHNEEAGERLCSDEGIRGKEGLLNILLQYVCGRLCFITGEESLLPVDRHAEQVTF